MFDKVKDFRDFSIPVKKGLLLVFLTTKSFAFSTWCDPTDINLIYCAPFNEGQGLFIRDQSRTGLTGTISGTPAWVDNRASLTNWGNRLFNTSLTSFTYEPIQGSYLVFTGGVGEYVTTPATALFDYSLTGNKGYTIFFVYKFRQLAGDNDSILNWDQSANLCGWSIEKEANGINMNLLMQYSVIGNFYWRNAAGAKMTFTDTRPHSFGIIDDGNNNMDMYYDGQFINRNSAVTDPITCAGGSALAFAKDHASGTNSAGGQGLTMIWKGVPIKGDSFMKALHEAQFGSGD